MSKKKEHWIKRLAIWISTTIIAPIIVSLIVDFSKGKPILSTIWAILKWCANAVWSFLNLEIKVWWLLVSIILFIIIIYFIDKFKKSAWLDVENYTEDKIKELKWSWRWRLYGGVWEILDMKPHCPKCDTPLVEREHYGLHFECLRCDFVGSREFHEDSEKIKFLIYDNARKMEAEKKNF